MAINTNQVVSVEYELTITGEKDIVDSNMGQAPLEFITGKGHVIPGLEEELLKLDNGASQVINVKSENAYGPRSDEAVETLPKEQFADVELKEGLQLYGQSEDGQTVMVTVVSFSDSEVTVDYNHPLAGKDLTFNVNIKDVRDATPDEIATGMVGGGADNHGCGCGSNDGSCGA